MTIIVVDHIFMDRKYLGRKRFLLSHHNKNETKNDSNKNVNVHAAQNREKYFNR